MNLQNNYTSRIKLNTMKDEKNHRDIYCFECHRPGDIAINCSSCPRVYHSKCLDFPILIEKDWTCPECEITQSSFLLINQSTSLQCYTTDDFNRMLKYALGRLKLNPQAKILLESMDNTDYLNYIIRPMDFEILEKNIDLKKYSSTDGFISDIKWIVHNSIIYNGNQSKITNIARTFLKVIRHEMTEIKLCSECYLRGIQPTSTDWFIKPCSIPHTLCWAKMKGYQSWPAKVLRIVNDDVDVRFFGEHDRAWIPLKNCFVLSKEYPGSDKKKFNSNLELSLIELQRHIDQLKLLYGYFTYAPLQISLSKVRPFKFVSIIDDSTLPSYMKMSCGSHICRSKIKYVKHKCSSIKNSSSSNQNKLIKRNHSNINDDERLIKRQRTSSKSRNVNFNFIDDNNLSQSTLNVFDILNQSNIKLSSSRLPDEMSMSPTRSTVRSISPTDNKLRIQALLRKYIHCKPSTVDLISSDVKSSMDQLLDSIEFLESSCDANINVNALPRDCQVSERIDSVKDYHRKKISRKSNLQQSIVSTPTRSNYIACSSLDQSFSGSLPCVPLRPLSVSPPSMRSFESISTEMPDRIITKHKQRLTKMPSIEVLDIKLEPIDQDEQQLTESSILTSSFLISPSLKTNSLLPTRIPMVPSTSQILTTIPSEHISSSALSVYPSTRRQKNITNRRVESSINHLPAWSNSSLEKQSNSIQNSHHISNEFPISNQESIQVPPQRNVILLDDHETQNEIQMIINNFNDQFQQLLVNLTSKIQSTLQTTRTKYEKDLEETRRSYRVSLDELHRITNEQIQEIHTDLELQYWKRLSDMRNRYESKLQCEEKKNK